MLLTILKSLLVIFVTMILRVLYDTISCYWLTPRRIKKIMERQGVTGPKPRPLTGNILEISAMVSQSASKDCDSIHHDIVGRLLPHYVSWSKQYGRVLNCNKFVFSWSWILNIDFVIKLVRLIFSDIIQWRKYPPSNFFSEECLVFKLDYKGLEEDYIYM